MAPKVSYSICMIVKEPHAVLRKVAVPVAAEEFGSKKLMDIIEKMSKALQATDDGIGIAAPQIGVSKRIFLASEEALAMDKELKNPDARFEKEKDKNKKWEYYVFINPEIVQMSAKKSAGTEGCLSVPKKYGEVARAEKIRVRAKNEAGKTFERGASGLFARLFQHEIDHLNGILFIDKAVNLRSVDSKKTT